MFKNKHFLVFIIFFLLFLTISCVSAVEDNYTDELNVNEGIIESSVDNDVVAEVSNENNMTDLSLQNSGDDNLADIDGEFIDVNDAYVYLNQFRTENGVWQWNSDDTTKTVFNTNNSNQLNPLARDLTLEETAKIRAKEIAISFSHTRPDDTDCFTAFPDGLMAMGENIAMGQTSCYQVTEAWKETNDPYEGQGHRRNMLYSNFNCVGIAGYKLNGIIYWVQDFGYSNNISQGEIKYPDNTNGNTNDNGKDNTNRKLAVKITAKSATFKSKVKSKKYIITLKNDKNPVKKVKVFLKIGKKTYTAKTNNKGKATFKITKLTKKGIYTGKINFKGDKTYKESSKTIKIKVKK